MKASNDIKLFIKSKEGLRLKPYRCSAGVPTIGYGATFYENGAKVTMKDAPITKERADELFDFHLSFFERDLNKLISKRKLSQNQFDSLLSFAFNVGTDIDQDNIPEGLGDSTLLKKVLLNPADPSIQNEFLKWDKAAGLKIPGLSLRRIQESKIYLDAYSNI